MKTNAVIDAILSRRSIRAFSDEPIAREDLEAIVACGQWAPSANNRQEQTFVVVDDRARIARLAETVRLTLGRKAYDMYAPRSIVIVAHAKDAPFGREDDGCAMENMMLAAHSLGIGSVWINQLQDVCDEPAVRAELDELGVPADSVVHGVCALGYAAAAGRSHERTSDVVWVG
ncbi:nitroreductase [Eggerthella guodeyinii]|uniref:Nitroreductase n=1 Tax=Eggerthella guodeyinii TaxID=2690837 RepID=A0A6L7IQ10_9ACTN|nr:nitroreductase [Eggerthella guodeyinii]QOS69819.1 nitroreductase [Eggerthella guodeyinii]